MELFLVSFNLRCIFDDGDGVNCFIHRGGMVLEKIRAESPDVICFQEAMPAHIQFLRQYLPEYHFVFNQRNADLTGEGLAIAFKKNSLDIYSYSMFWLSDTPFVPGSRFEQQSACPRIVQNMILRDSSTGKLFRIHNVHLDHAFEEAQEKGIAVLLNHVAQCQQQWNLPVFILGDFNAQPESNVIRMCKEYAPLPLADTTEQLPPTWHDFGRGFCEPNKTARKIDYIFTDENTSQCRYTSGVWTDSRNGIYLSDHYPVFLKITL